MARQSIADLNDYLFAQLDVITNSDLTPEELDKEIDRSKAIQGIAKTIIDGANVALQAQNPTNGD